MGNIRYLRKKMNIKNIQKINKQNALQKEVEENFLNATNKKLTLLLFRLRLNCCCFVSDSLVLLLLELVIKEEKEEELSENWKEEAQEVVVVVVVLRE